jgi:GNAT superfamily N-acetyltransferase
LASCRAPSGPERDVVAVVMRSLNGPLSQGGGGLLLRRIRPSDRLGLAAFHQGLSPRSVYRRFFSVHPELSAREIERFTRVDGVDRLALVVEDGQRLVAIGRYDRTPGTAEAEVAFVVADAFQHHGLAPVLLERLADAARRQGIMIFTAITLVENRDMLHVFSMSGYPVVGATEDGVVSIRFPIDTPPVGRTDPATLTSASPC